MTISTISQASPKQSAIGLVAALDVVGEGPDYRALSRWPWLSIEPRSAPARGRWFRIRYRLGLYDRPTRLVISYRRGSDEIGWHLLPGPVLGRAEGIGIAPEDATAIWLSPVAEAGPFNFMVEAIEMLSIAEVFRMGLSGDRSRFLSTLGTWALGWREEARGNFLWATQHTSLAEWPSYRDRLSVGSDLQGFERPRCDWTKTPEVKLLARIGAGTKPRQIDATIEALQAQNFSRWTLRILGAKGVGESWSAQDNRVAACPDCDALAGANQDLVGFIAFGDRLAPAALSCFIESARRTPSALALYCDEEKIGQAATPIFKPDWSPHLEAAKPYVGRLLLTTLAYARGRIPSEAGALDESMFAGSVLRDLERRDVVHIPRFLIQTTPRSNPIIHARELTRRNVNPSVTVVIPTRDQADLLRKTIASLLGRTRYAAFDVVIVDNGSTDPQAMAVLAEAARDARVRCVHAPGVFNFSELCNLGAAHAQGEVVIFLNNDVEIIDSDWIGELAPWATDPKVGAVGCKLLYPDGRIQHAGIILGLGDSAGHCDTGAKESDPGWLGRNQAVHETSAVTGACLAVERAKFLAVDGFDAVNLPIEFNDIDLCLRLEAFGHQTIWTPFTRIVHLESASRGRATFRRLEAHAAERAYFWSRWADRLRDDPFYHPGLSLFSFSLSLA